MGQQDCCQHEDQARQGEGKRSVSAVAGSSVPAVFVIFRMTVPSASVEIPLPVFEMAEPSS